jgi:3-deoxy-D-manno-octulosonic-acid transferase
VEALIKQSKTPYLRRTALYKTPKSKQPHIILLDTIGELAKSYSIADIVFIGGSLVPVGGHNVLEPAVFSKPVIFGKHMDNFREMVSLLLNKKGAIQVNNVEEFIEQSLLLLNNKKLCRQLGEISFQVIKENNGAVINSMVILKKILKNSVSNKLQ